MEIKKEVLFNACSCQVIKQDTKCNSKRYTETGFCTLYFINFTSDSLNFLLDDSVNNYLKTQSIIF